ncbi:hypothetical protein ANO11243_016730 [Dothideomycetidae sp. 11243]|nr:hypothetical protein ANO11243_016730 [fungal sp. No.11243]
MRITRGEWATADWQMCNLQRAVGASSPSRAGPRSSSGLVYVKTPALSSRRAATKHWRTSTRGKREKSSRRQTPGRACARPGLRAQGQKRWGPAGRDRGLNGWASANWLHSPRQTLSQSGTPCSHPAAYRPCVEIFSER